MSTLVPRAEFLDFLALKKPINLLISKKSLLLWNMYINNVEVQGQKVFPDINLIHSSVYRYDESYLYDLIILD